MAKLMSKKISGATLIEVLIAMVIITSVFSMAIVVFNNILASGVTDGKVRALNQMKALQQHLIITGNAESKELMIDSITYRLEVVVDAGLAGLETVKIRATQQGKLLGEIRFQYQMSKNEHP